MKHEMSHSLSPEVAKRVAEKAFEAYSEQYAKYNPRIIWANDNRAEASFMAKGVTLKGIIELKPGKIAFDVDVPFVLKMFKGKAIGVIESELKKWTAKAEAGEI